MITVIIGSQLSYAANMNNPVQLVEAGTIAEVVSRIDEHYPGFRNLVVSSRGVRGNISITRESDSRGLTINSVLVDGDKIDIGMTAIPGG